MKTRLLLLMLLVTMLTSCGSGSGSSVSRHFEKSGGFSLTTPTGWKVVEIPGLKYKIIAGTPVDGFAPNIYVVDEGFAGSLDEYVAPNIQLMEKSLQDFNKLSRQDFRLDSGDRAVKLVATNVQDTRALKQTSYFVDGGDTKFVITCSKLVADSRDMSEEFDASVRSFRKEHQ